MMITKSGWRKGPSNHLVCSPPHDRPIFCLDVGEETFVSGSADHGLREYNIDSGKHIRELFGKKYGHKEWVSTCCLTPSGHVISGGMDSVVCFWEKKGPRCDHFLGHQGSISKVMGDEKLGISASYDATMILWDLGKRQTTQKLLGPHKQAIMTFDWHQSLLVSGDKAGVMAIWDLNRCCMVRAVKSHKGAISNIRFSEKNGMILSTGLNDGCICATDMRTNSGVCRQMVHKGAVNGLKVVGDYVVTCSADSTMKIIKSPDFQTIHKVQARDMVFAVEEANGVILGGTAGGNIVGADLQTGEILYGYGVMKKGECRLLGVSKQKNRLVCAGEDQSPCLLTF